MYVLWRMIMLSNTQNHMSLSRPFGAFLEGASHRTCVASQHALATLLLGNASQTFFLCLVTRCIAMEGVRQLLPCLLR